MYCIIDSHVVLITPPANLWKVAVWELHLLRGHCYVCICCTSIDFSLFPELMSMYPYMSFGVDVCVHAVFALMYLHLLHRCYIFYVCCTVLSTSLAPDLLSAFLSFLYRHWHWYAYFFCFSIGVSVSPVFSFFSLCLEKRSSFCISNERWHIHIGSISVQSVCAVLASKFLHQMSSLESLKSQSPRLCTGSVVRAKQFSFCNSGVVSSSQMRMVRAGYTRNGLFASASQYSTKLDDSNSPKLQAWYLGPFRQLLESSLLRLC